jgi:CheY-like chemotaxis protein/HPt (histidine-containing phosphotransfer) domain-containing protein
VDAYLEYLYELILILLVLAVSGLLVTLLIASYMHQKSLQRATQEPSWQRGSQTGDELPSENRASTGHEQREVINLLIEPALRKFTRAFNETSQPGHVEAELVTAAESISFLLRGWPIKENLDTGNVLALVDEVVSVVAPLTKRFGRIYVIPDSDGHREFELDIERTKQILLSLFCSHFSNGRTPGDISMRISFHADQLGFQFPANFQPELSAALNNQIRASKASWSNGVLSVPAAALSSPQNQWTTGSLSALLITDNPEERLSLTGRLKSLGVNCITDFRSEQLDMCIVADENSEAFRSILPYLAKTTYILLLNNRTIYLRPFWVQVDDPITQTVLQKVISEIRHTRDNRTQKKVLAVDDNPTNMQLLDMQLAELGHIVTKASSGIEAIGFTEQADFDLVFMDIQMPDMNGIETTLAIRKTGNQIPVIGLTAHATPHERQEYLDAGMADVLIKPVRMQNLKSVIRRVDHPASLPVKSTVAPTRPIFDLTLALSNANQRPDLASELMDLLISTLPDDQSAINDNAENREKMRKAVHKLHGAIRFCGVPRLANAVEKLEVGLKEDNNDQIQLLLNLFNGEVTALIAWHEDNPDPFVHRKQL